MANKKKRKKRSFVPESEAKTELKRKLKQFNRKIVIRLLISFVVVFGIYQLCIKLSEIYGIFLIQEIMLSVYYIATTVIACIFIVQNRGISNDIPTPDQLSPNWSAEKKEDFIEKYKASKEKAKKWLYILIPLIFTLLIDTIYLFYFD